MWNKWYQNTFVGSGISLSLPPSLSLSSSSLSYLSLSLFYISIICCSNHKVGAGLLQDSSSQKSHTLSGVINTVWFNHCSKSQNCSRIFLSGTINHFWVNSCTCNFKNGWVLIFHWIIMWCGLFWLWLHWFVNHGLWLH